MQLESMSQNIIKIVTELSKNDGLAMLLVNYQNNPFDSSLPPIDKVNLINPFNKDKCRIYPYAFTPDALVEDIVFLRVYYDNGRFKNNEVIADSQINIDIVCAKELWLITDGVRSLVRPYEIMGRIKSIIGKRSTNPIIKLNFESFKLMSANDKFDVIRLYFNYKSVEAKNNGL